MAEIISCPKCTRKLQIPEQFFGQIVQCPECQHRFTAVSAAVSSQPIPSSAVPMSRGLANDRPSRRVDEPLDDYPRRRRHRYEDDDYDDDFDRPRRPLQYDKAHRSGLVFALGLISLVGGFSFLLPFLLGPIAWGLGQYDLREMREGSMDPSGESLTRAGQVLGIIATCLLALAGSVVGCVILAG